MYWVVGVGLIYSATVAAIALGRGRQEPARFIPWIIAIVVLGLDVALHVMMSIGAMAEDPWGGGWLLIGTLAIAGILFSAIWQPRLAGWAYVLSALLMPLAVVTVASVVSGGYDVLVPLPVLLGFYSTRAIIIGLLLVLSATPKRPEVGTRNHPGTTPVHAHARDSYDEAQVPGRSML